jgi:hypothetical protein
MNMIVRFLSCCSLVFLWFMFTVTVPYSSLAHCARSCSVTDSTARTRFRSARRRPTVKQSEHCHCHRPPRTEMLLRAARLSVFLRQLSVLCHCQAHAVPVFGLTMQHYILQLIAHTVTSLDPLINYFMSLVINCRSFQSSLYSYVTWTCHIFVYTYILCRRTMWHSIILSHICLAIVKRCTTRLGRNRHSH